MKSIVLALALILAPLTAYAGIPTNYHCKFERTLIVSSSESGTTTNSKAESMEFDLIGADQKNVLAVYRGRKLVLQSLHFNEDTGVDYLVAPGTSNTMISYAFHLASGRLVMFMSLTAENGATLSSLTYGKCVGTNNGREEEAPKATE